MVIPLVNRYTRTQLLLQTQLKYMCTSCVKLRGYYTIGKFCRYDKQNIQYQLEFFGWVGGKRSIMANVTKPTVCQRSHDPSQAPVVWEKNIFPLFRFTQPVKNNMLGISYYTIILFDLYLKMIL